MLPIPPPAPRSPDAWRLDARARGGEDEPIWVSATSFMYSSSILMLFLACATACFVSFRRRVQGMEDKERELRSQWNARTSNEQDEDEPTRSRSTKRDKPKRATKMPTKGGRTLVPNYDPMEEGCDPMESSGGCCPTDFEQLPSSSSSRSKKGKKDKSNDVGAVTSTADPLLEGRKQAWGGGGKRIEGAPAPTPPPPEVSESPNQGRTDQQRISKAVKSRPRGLDMDD